MELFQGSWQESSVSAVWLWESHVEVTVSLLCFKTRSTKVPSPRVSLGPVSVLISGTNQLSNEGAKALPFQPWPGTGEAGDVPAGVRNKERPAAAFILWMCWPYKGHCGSKTGVWNGKAGEQVEQHSAPSGVAGKSRDCHLSLCWPMSLPWQGCVGILRAWHIKLDAWLRQNRTYSAHFSKLFCGFHIIQSRS